MRLSFRSCWAVVFCAVGIGSAPAIAQSPELILSPALPIHGVPLEETSLAPRKWSIPVREINRIVFSRDGKKVAVSGERSYRELFVGIYDLASGQLLHQMRPQGAAQVQGLEFSADDRILAVGSDGLSNAQSPKLGGTAVYDVASGAELWSVRGNVSDLAFSQDGRTIACNDDDLIRIRDARNGQLKRTFTGEEGQNEFNVALSPDGSIVAVSTFKWHDVASGRGHLDDVIALWDVKSGRFLRYLYGFVEPESRLSFSRDGSFLVTDVIPSGGWRTDNWQRIAFDPTISLASRLWSSTGLFPVAAEVPVLHKSQLALWNGTQHRVLFWLPANGELEIPTALSPNGMWLASGARVDQSFLTAGANPEDKNPLCTLSLWRLDQIVKAYQQKKLPTSFSRPEICLLNFAHYVSVGDWSAASRLVLGASSPQSFSPTQDLKAQNRRLAVELIEVGQKDGKTWAVFHSEVVVANAPGWMERIRLRGETPGRDINHSVFGRVELRHTPQGWKIVPPAELPLLPPALVPYAAAHLAQNQKVDLAGQATLLPSYSNIVRLRELAVDNAAQENFVSQQDWERLRWGNLRAKIQSAPDSRAYFLDPSDTSRIGFEMNQKLFGVAKKSVENPEQTLLVFESHDGQPYYRQNGRVLVVTADGQVHLLPPGEFHLLKREP